MMPTSRALGIHWCDSNRVGENTKLCLQREGNSRIKVNENNYTHNNIMQDVFN